MPKRWNTEVAKHRNAYAIGMVKHRNVGPPTPSRWRNIEMVDRWNAYAIPMARHRPTFFLVKAPRSCLCNNPLTDVKGSVTL
jgi:hypothetical protein